ncbi:MAG: hypothetical protein ACHQUB_01490 [Candidatus Saccharimonadia bacterium]
MSIAPASKTNLKDHEDQPGPQRVIKEEQMRPNAVNRIIVGLATILTTTVLSGVVGVGAMTASSGTFPIHLAAAEVPLPSVPNATVPSVSSPETPPLAFVSWYTEEASRWQTTGNCIIFGNQVYSHWGESNGNPTAQNPISSASGLFGFLDSTWNHFGGYVHARQAPPIIQWVRFFQVFADGKGASNWRGDGCGYGT